MWEVDKLPTGPGLVKRHGRLDVNYTDPANPIPRPSASDAGKVLQVQGDGTVTWVDQRTLATQYNSDVAYDDGTYDYNES